MKATNSEGVRETLFVQVAQKPDQARWTQLINLLDQKERRDVALFRELLRMLRKPGGGGGEGLIGKAELISGTLTTAQQLLPGQPAAYLITSIVAVPTTATSVSVPPRVNITAQLSGGGTPTNIFRNQQLSGVSTTRSGFQLISANAVANVVNSGETLAWTNATAATATALLFDVYVYGFRLT